MPQDANPDITALSKQLQQTQLAYQMASEMSQFKGGFLARTSHELRSPLSSLVSLLQLILSDLCEDPAEERECVAQAHSSALKLMKLLDEIISVSKAQHGTNTLDIQPLQLTEVLENAYSLTYLQAANSNLEFQVSPSDPELYVLADPRWLQQVLVSLIDAAISWMREKHEGSIRMSVHPVPEAESVHIWIDVECPPSVWSEPVDLLQSTQETDGTANPRQETPSKTSAKLSPGLNLLGSQGLMDLMQGRLEVVEVLAEDPARQSAEQNMTRLQCTIPLLLPESE